MLELLIVILWNLLLFCILFWLFILLLFLSTIYFLHTWATQEITLFCHINLIFFQKFNYMFKWSLSPWWNREHRRLNALKKFGSSILITDFIGWLDYIICKFVCEKIFDTENIFWFHRVEWDSQRTHNNFIEDHINLLLVFSMLLRKLFE